MAKQIVRTANGPVERAVREVISNSVFPEWVSRAISGAWDRFIESKGLDDGVSLSPEVAKKEFVVALTDALNTLNGRVAVEQAKDIAAQEGVLQGAGQ